MSTKMDSSHFYFLLATFTLLCQYVASQDHFILTLGQLTGTMTSSCDGYSYFSVEVTEPCMDLRITVNPIQGQPDLYVSKYPNKYPTLQSLAWSSYEWDADVLTISSWDPEFTIGTYYIGVHTYCGDDVHSGDTESTFTIKAEMVPTTHEHTEIAINGNISDTLPAEGYKYYRFCLPRSCVNIVLELQNCIDPSECPMTYAWPELLLSRSIERPTINDHAWKLASVAKRTIDIQHNDPEFYPGHYFVGVYGWCTPAEFCPNKSTCGPCEYADNVSYKVLLRVEDVNSGCTPKQALEYCAGSASFSFIDVFLLMTMGILAISFK